MYGKSGVTANIYGFILGEIMGDFYYTNFNELHELNLPAHRKLSTVIKTKIRVIR